MKSASIYEIQKSICDSPWAYSLLSFVGCNGSADSTHRAGVCSLLNDGNSSLIGLPWRCSPRLGCRQWQSTHSRTGLGRGTNMANKRVKLDRSLTNPAQRCGPGDPIDTQHERCRAK